MLLQAIPFSAAVTSSDGKTVLYHTCGSEPGAAQFLTETLTRTQGKSAFSFLAALLGELEVHALKTVHGKRSCWKGSVSVTLSAGGPPLRSSFSGGASSRSRPADQAPPASAAHEARRKGEPAGMEMGKAHSSPTELLHDLTPEGKVVTSAAGPGPGQRNADAAMMAEIAGTAAAAVPASGEDSLSFGQTNFMISDPDLPPSQFLMRKFSSRRVSPTDCEASKGAKWRGFQGVPHSHEEGVTRSASGAVPDKAFKPRERCPARPCKSMSASSPRPQATRQSLLMSGDSIELCIGSDETKTKSFLRSLSSLAQQAQASDDGKAGSPKKGLVHSSEVENDSLFTNKASRAASLNPVEPLTESMAREQRFDILLRLLRPADGERSPVLVVIYNNSDHLRARATLSALAESQLELLSGIMPQHAIQFLALQSTADVPQHVGQLARAHKGVTLLFMDIVGFTAMSKAVEPQEVMVFLNTLFSLFDQLTNLHCVHKVETAGDCYIVAGGIMTCQQSTDGFQVVAEDGLDPAASAKHVMEFAKAMLEVAQQVKMPDTHQPVRIRVGLHTGDVVSGMIGSKLPKFSVFGDTMNTAARMESTGVPGRIHVSASTRMLLPQERWECTGLQEIKGKGPMETFLWIPELPANPSLPLRGAISPPTPCTSALPCVLLKQTQCLLKQMNAHTSKSASQWLDDALPLVLGGECEPN